MTRIPPVLLMLMSIIAMWLVDRLVDVEQFSIPSQTFISGFLLMVGFVITFIGLWSFRRASTTADPVNPEHASRLVTSSIYQFTRNPMYLGMLQVVLSWMIYLGNLLNIVLVVLFIWFLNRYQIPSEEKALREIFGEQYQEYCSRVRRWL